MFDYYGEKIQTCPEMLRLINKLVENNIPIEVKTMPHLKSLFDTDFIQVCVSVNGRQVADAIWHPFSYGYENGLLETMPGGPGHEEDGVEGWCDADEAYANLSRAYYLAH